MNPISDTYLSIAGPSEGLYKELGSRFIAFACPIESEEDSKALLSHLKAKYHDARHHCCAFRLGLGGEKFRASDDGEPAGSAGRPILAAIDSSSLSDIAIIVVRYFGGIKLGVPGLIRAYRSAAQDAIDNATVVEKIAGSWYRLEFGYEQMPSVMKMVKDLDLQQREQDFKMQCSMLVRVRLAVEKDFLERSQNISNFISTKQ